MPYFSWMGAEETLTSAALTVRAQTISPNDTGRLLWDVFFPRENADSTKIRSILDVDYRPTADRREWNARGRQINFITPGTAEIEFVPIEVFFRLDEYEINKLMEQTAGNADLFRGLVRNRVPDRVDRLAESIYRRLEVDAMTAWSLGQITVKNPTTGATSTVSLGFDATRYEDAGTTPGAAVWTNLNAYTELLSFLNRAVDRIGGIPEGVILRMIDYSLVQQSAPKGFNAITLTRAQLLDQIQQDIGGTFRFVIREDSVDISVDGGLDVARTKVWPTAKVAVIPPGGRIGSTYFSPVTRAYEFAPEASEGLIDIRSVSVFNEVTGNGRELTVEAQLNGFTFPNEQLVYVLNTT